MDKQRATEILRDAIKEDNSLLSLGDWHLSWPINDLTEINAEEARLDGQYTADQLEAIAWWMRNNNA